MHIVNRRASLLAAAVAPAFAVGLLAPSAFAQQASDHTVVVTAPPGGSAAEGYAVSHADLGPLGPLSPEDTPYSIDVAPSALLQNQQAISVTDALKYLPSTTMADFGGQYSIGRPQSRGFQSSVIQNVRIDGMSAANAALPLEQFQDLEVLNGLSGSLYGGANPAGTFNFIQRRTPDKAFLEAEASYISNGIGEGFVDAGGRTADGAFGARFTGLYQDGQGYVSHSNYQRDLESLALDWHAFDGLIVQGNLSRSNWSQDGYPAVFDYAQNKQGQATIAVPGPVDPTKVGYGQSFDVSQTETTTGSLRAIYAINRDWRLTVGGLYQDAYGWPLAIANTLTNGAGAYTSVIAPAGNIGKTTYSDIAYLNGHVTIVGFGNDLLIGTNGFQTNFFSPLVKSSTTLGTASLANPVVYATPSTVYNKASYHSSTPADETFIVGDTITLTKQWQVMVSASEDWIYSKSYNAAGAVTSAYSDSGVSPAASLIFRPVDNVMAYFTYADSLQMGDTAPATVVNANENLPPYRSEQYELGAKAKIFGLDVKADIFRINRPYANTNPATNIYEVIGEQVNDGFELMTTGRIAKDWTLFGGFTIIDPKLTDTGVASTQNKEVVGVPRFQFNELVEYDVPQISGLTLGANLHYTGLRAADDANTQSIPGYFTTDLEARYAVLFQERKLTFHLGVDNIADQRYWASLLPADITGSASGAYQLSPGAPREFLASLTLDY